MKTETIPIHPGLLTWARERAGLDMPMLAKRFPKLTEWETGTGLPTLNQLENFARTVRVPIGYLFLTSPPEEPLPIPDLRTIADRTVTRPSPNLLDTLYLCQQRQDWYRDYARLHGVSPLDFIGSAAPSDNPAEVAEIMRGKLGLSLAEIRRMSNWSDALHHFITRAEESGILVMASSVVGSNSHRKLEVAEFRGFALSDDLAPLIFLNSSDSRAAQMFTLAHELVHLWLGQSGVSDPEAGRLPSKSTERWCNAVAAELLMPLSAMREELRDGVPVPEEIQRLARIFKVSTLVALRRIYDAGIINENELWLNYHQETERISGLNRESGGGDFYRTLGTRIGKRFARAVLASTLEGQTLFQDAFRMLGMRKSSTFYEAARELGVML